MSFCAFYLFILFLKMKNSYILKKDLFYTYYRDKFYFFRLNLNRFYIISNICLYYILKLLILNYILFEICNSKNLILKFFYLYKHCKVCKYYFLTINLNIYIFFKCKKRNSFTYILFHQFHLFYFHILESNSFYTSYINFKKL